MAFTAASSIVSTRRSVRFTSVTVHYHVTVLGDSPCVSSGAPIALGWQRVGEAETASIDEFEANATTPRRRSSTELKLGAGARQRRLQQAGVKTTDIMRRIETCDNLRYAQFESIQRAKIQDAKNRRKLQKQQKNGGDKKKFWQRLFPSRA